MKLIIAGGRDFTDVPLAAWHFTAFVEELHPEATALVPCITEIVSGTARGADKVGEEVAKAFGIPVKQFIPDWDGLGKRAGFVRNAEMAEYGDALLAFWDKRSKGTKHMIDTATKKGLKVKVVYYNV